MSGLNRPDAGRHYLARYQECREKLVTAEAELANARDLLGHVERQRNESLLMYDGLLLQILENAPPCWDGDQSDESIALEYVRHLEAAVAESVLVMEGNVDTELPNHRDGCGGECLL